MNLEALAGLKPMIGSGTEIAIAVNKDRLEKRIRELTAQGYSEFQAELKANKEAKSKDMGAAMLKDEKAKDEATKVETPKPYSIDTTPAKDSDIDSVISDIPDPSKSVLANTARNAMKSKQSSEKVEAKKPTLAGAKEATLDAIVSVGENVDNIKDKIKSGKIEEDIRGRVKTEEENQQEYMTELEDEQAALDKITAKYPEISEAEWVKSVRNKIDNARKMVYMVKSLSATRGSDIRNETAIRDQPLKEGQADINIDKAGSEIIKNAAAGYEDLSIDDKLSMQAYLRKISATSKGKDEQPLLAEKYGKMVLGKVASSRSGGLGLQQAKLDNAIHAKNLVDDIREGKTVPNEAVHQELVESVALMLSGSAQTSEARVMALKSPTWEGKLKEFVQKATGKPMPTSSPALLEQLYHIIDRQGKLTQDMRDEYVRDVRNTADASFPTLRKDYKDEFWRINYGNRFIGDSKPYEGNVREFSSVEEAEAAKLPVGTKIKINGKSATVR